MHPTLNSESEPKIANTYSKDPNDKGLKEYAVKLSSLIVNSQHIVDQRISHTIVASKKSLTSE